MPTTHTIISYEFNELSPEARAKAIKRRREEIWKQGDDSLYHSLWMLFASRIQEAGWMLRCPLNQKELDGEGISINWSISCSQGDGVCFYHTAWMSSSELQHLIDTSKAAGSLTEADAAALSTLISNHGYCFKLNHIGRYSHHNSITAESDYHIDDDFLGGTIPATRPAVEARIEELTNTLLELARDLCKELYEAGEAESDYHNTDEFIAEELAGLDDHYLADGRVFDAE